MVRTHWTSAGAATLPVPGGSTENHGWTIVAVAPSSAVAEGDLEIDEARTHIDGRAAAELTLSDFQGLLSRLARTCVVPMSRHRDLRTATQQLRNRL